MTVIPTSEDLRACRGCGRRLPSIALIEGCCQQCYRPTECAVPSPLEFDHIFRTLFGLPPSKGDLPLCGARLPDSWDWQGPRRSCPACAALAGDLAGART